MIRRRDFSEAHISHLPILSGTRVNVESLVCTFLFFFGDCLVRVFIFFS